MREDKSQNRKLLVMRGSMIADKNNELKGMTQTSRPILCKTLLQSKFNSCKTK